MLSFTKKEQIVILVLVITILGLIGYNIHGKNNLEIVADSSLEDQVTKVSASEIEYTEKEKEKTEDVKEEDNSYTILVIDICGEVNNPGVYELKEGDIVEDAINKAGGLTKEADIIRINRSEKIHDEQKIIVYKIGDKPEEGKLEKAEAGGTNMYGNSTDGNKININTATKAELETLPGIGDVKASKIIEYRNNNKFKTIDEITNVSGVGSKTFESIKDLITVK